MRPGKARAKIQSMVMVQSVIAKYAAAVTAADTKPPPGYKPIPDSPHGGMRKRKSDGSYVYWYPSKKHAEKAVKHHAGKASAGGVKALDYQRARDHADIAQGARDFADKDAAPKWGESAMAGGAKRRKVGKGEYVLKPVDPVHESGSGYKLLHREKSGTGDFQVVRDNVKNLDHANKAVDSHQKRKT